jgi:hypothetical protein
MTTPPTAAARGTPKMQSTPNLRGSPHIRRRIQYTGVRPGGVHSFACYSRSRGGTGVRHVQEIELSTGRVRCSCEHFVYRCARHHPGVAQPEDHCAHLARAIAWLRRHDFRPDVQPRCARCGRTGAGDYHRLADARGDPLPGVICNDCIATAGSDVEVPARHQT